ncbi:MAG: hypothetical protein ACKO5Z_10270 [Burkholderiaceae bacterium]
MRYLSLVAENHEKNYLMMDSSARKEGQKLQLQSVARAAATN